MGKSSIKFRKKIKTSASLVLTSAVIVSSSNIVTVFADEIQNKDIQLQESQSIQKNSSDEVTISNFVVKLDGNGRVMVRFAMDKDIDLTNILDKKNDIIIKLTTKDGVNITKQKFTYDGYLNDVNGDGKYGRFQVVPAGYYSTVFIDKTGKLDNIKIEDVQVELTIKNNGVETKKLFQGANMKEETPEVPQLPEKTKINEVTTNAPDQVLVEFDLSKELDLALKSSDNIIIKAIDKNTGEELCSKNKIWSGYLNNAQGKKFGSGSVVPAGTYTTVFNATQLEYNTLENVAIELEVKKGEEVLAKETYGDISNNKPEAVKVSNLIVERKEEGTVFVKFDIDQAINLGLTTKDNIVVKAIDKNTGKELSSKNKTWTGYLNNSGEKFGLGDVLKAGTYSTTFSGESLKYTNPKDVVIEISVTNNEMTTTVRDGEVIENPESIEKAVKIENLKLTPQGKAALVEFDIDQVMDLKLNSKDNLILTAIDKESGDILASKNKTWTKYLNDVNNNQYGLNNVIKPGKYSTVFSEEQLRGIDPANVIIEVKAIKDGKEYIAATDEIKESEAVRIDNVKVENFNTEDAKITFSLDKNINLELTSKDNIVISAIDKYTGETIKSKNKTWTNYLNNEAGEQFGLGELVKAGTYSNVFTKKQLGNKPLEDIIFEISVKRNGINSTYRTGSLESKFEDVKGHWANDAIVEFTSKGYIDGFEDGTFAPEKGITRAEFVKIANRVFGFTEKAEENFKDVNENAWYYNEILIAKKAGYIHGNGDNTFKPNNIMNREEAAKIIASIVNAKGDGNLDNFKDKDKISKWAIDYVDALNDNGVISGYENGTFRPKNGISRAEAVSMLSRSENLKNN